MLKRRAAVVGAAAIGALVLLPSMGASAAQSWILNGDFEADAVGATTITNWTTMNQVVDLGVTQIAGCTTVDTSDYDTLRDWASYAGDPGRGYTLGQVSVGQNDVVLVPNSTDEIWIDSRGIVAANSADAFALHYGTVNSTTEFYIVQNGNPVALTSSSTGTDLALYGAVVRHVKPLFGTYPDPAVRADNVPAGTDSTYWSFAPGFTSTTATAGSSSRYVSLASTMNSQTVGGYVAHGPAIYSDPFTIAEPRTISLDWQAQAGGDDYHVFGYVLRTSDCTQTEIIDSTGGVQAWNTTSVTLSTPGDYRFVFVSGTYDRSWGRAAGATLNVDNIRSQTVITGTGLDLDLDLDLGQPVANATVQVSGGGLQANSGWTAVMHSTPVTIGSGTTDANGNFWQLASLPSSVEPGRHTITLTGTDPSGAPLSRVAYITVTGAGTLGYVSTSAAEPELAAVIEEALPNTGANAAPIAMTAGALLVAGGVVSTIAFWRRRSRAS